MDLLECILWIILDGIYDWWSYNNTAQCRYLILQHVYIRLFYALEIRRIKRKNTLFMYGIIQRGSYLLLTNEKKTNYFIFESVVNNDTLRNHWSKYLYIQRARPSNIIIDCLGPHSPSRKNWNLGEKKKNKTIHRGPLIFSSCLVESTARSVEA